MAAKRKAGGKEAFMKIIPEPFITEINTEDVPAEDNSQYDKLKKARAAKKIKQLKMKLLQEKLPDDIEDLKASLKKQEITINEILTIQSKLLGFFEDNLEIQK